MRSWFTVSVFLHLATVVLCLLFLRSASAGPDEPKPDGVSRRTALSLEDAQRLAFEHNWDLLAAKVNVDAAAAQQVMARELPNPALSLSMSKLNIDGTTNATAEGNGVWQRSYDTVLAVSQLVEVGGKRSSRQGSAEAGLAGARAQLFDAKRVLDLAVARAYIAAVQTGTNAAVLRQSAALLREEAGIAAARLKAGDISVSDARQIEMAADRLELDARSAESASRGARIAVDVLIGVPRPAGDWSPVATLEALADAAPPTATDAAHERRPDVIAAAETVRKAEADLQLQRAVRIPDPTIGLQFEHNPPDGDYSIGFGVSLPLPVWNRNGGAIQQAAAAKVQAAVALERTRAQSAAEFATARIGFDDAFARWCAYRDAIRPKSEEIRKAVAFAYEKGGASLLDLLSAERNDNDVRLAAAQAAAETALAVETLKAALGNIEETK